MDDKDYVYCRIGMALISAQRVGECSKNIEKYFRGFIYMLALRFVKDSSCLDGNIKRWEKDFDYFIFKQQINNAL